jgi:hypothetical protein
MRPRQIRKYCALDDPCQALMNRHAAASTDG